VIDALTVAAAIVGWWGSACRVGQMHSSTHRPPVIWFHYACGALCLWSVAMVLLGRGGVTVLGMSASIAAYMLLTMHEWLPHPPAWALRDNLATKTDSSFQES
jgi:hypothetical protein